MFPIQIRRHPRFCCSIRFFTRRVLQSNAHETPRQYGSSFSGISRIPSIGSNASQRYKYANDSGGNEPETNVSSAENIADFGEGHRGIKKAPRTNPRCYAVMIQYSFAPAGMCGSSCRRFSRSSPFSLWMAESSMPQDSMPIMGRGGRLVIATHVLPMSCSGS